MPKGYIGRTTPQDEFDRFAERLWNFNPRMKNQQSFEDSYKEFMEGINRQTTLKDKAWQIISTEYLQDYNETFDQSTAPIEQIREAVKERKQHERHVPEYKIKYTHLAKVWNPKTNHFRVTYVEEVKLPNGQTVYRNMTGQFSKVYKVKKL